jgi:hypothetical protein
MLLDVLTIALTILMLVCILAAIIGIGLAMTILIRMVKDW